MATMKLLRLFFSLIVLLMFTGVWLWIAWEVASFDPTDAEPKRVFSDAQVMVAGFLASTVAAGTALVLGIEVRKIPPESDETPAAPASLQGKIVSDLKEIRSTVLTHALLTTGILLYALVGTVTLVLWFAKSSTSPDIVATFALGILGWLAGAFAGVFSADV